MRSNQTTRRATSWIAGTALGALAALPAADLLAVELAESGSVLVASRREPSELADRVNPSALEPIAESGGQVPQLADPASDPMKGAQAMVEQGTPAISARLASATEKRAEDGTTGELAHFRGVQAGITTLDSLILQWGEPAERGPLAYNADETGATSPSEGEVLRYEIDHFQKVEALIQEGVVRVIRVTLAHHSTVEELTELLSLGELETVDVVEPTSGELLAVCVPEKGLTLLIAATTSPSSGKVDQLILQPQESAAFTLRAEGRGPSQCSKSLADLNRAIELDPTNAHAHWLRAGLLRDQGRAQEALQDAAKAAKLVPENTAYRLRHAICLGDRWQYDEAVLKARSVLDETVTDAIRAEALHTMGRFAAMGDLPIAQKAIGFHSAAIEIADRLATSKDPVERHAAKDLLIDAHLAVANLIARRDYPNKTETVADWIGRASAFAEERISSDGGGLELRLLVAREALGALAALRPAIDPQPWIDEAAQTAQQLKQESSDGDFRQRIDWELGIAYQRAMRVEHARTNAERAMAHGQQAIHQLAAGGEPRTTSPDAERAVGELYFYLGAVEAVHNNDHQAAVGWYEKARPILTTERPESSFLVEREQGEKLISMAVSHWEVTQRELAVELTTKGLESMKRAVEAGVLKESALAVPYGNLETMHQELGNQAQASRYSKLYRSVGGKPRKESVAKRSRSNSAGSAKQKIASKSRNTSNPSSSGSRTALSHRPSAKRGMLR